MFKDIPVFKCNMLNCCMMYHNCVVSSMKWSDLAQDYLVSFLKNVKNSYFNDFIEKVYTSGYLHALLLFNLFIIYNKFFFTIYKEMEQTNMNQKIISIWELFNNIRDTLSRDELDQIRFNIYKNEAIYNYYIKKDKLTCKQTKKLNDAVTYLNK